MGLLSSLPPEMRSLLLLVGLLATLARAQRPGRPGSGGRPSPCSDGGRPACADGSRPERPPRGQRGPPTCRVGVVPVEGRAEDEMETNLKFIFDKKFQHCL